MSKTTIIETTTRNRVLGEDNVISCLIEVAQIKPNILASVMNVDKNSYILNNKEVKVGELGFEIQDSRKISIGLNVSGELVIAGKNARNYSLNSEGELIYTF